jgi:hypothetical protein
MSAKAQERVRWLEYYCDHDENATETCRHFGIPRMTLYRVFRRCDASRPELLEDQSRRPHTRRGEPLAASAPVTMPAVAAAVPPVPEAPIAPVIAAPPPADWGKTLRNTLIIACLLVNFAFMSFLLTTALLEGRTPDERPKTEASLTSVTLP